MAARLFGVVVMFPGSWCAGGLVLRFRGSHHIAAPSFANLGIKGALSNFMILARF